LVSTHLGRCPFHGNFAAVQFVFTSVELFAGPLELPSGPADRFERPGFCSRGCKAEPARQFVQTTFPLILSPIPLILGLFPLILASVTFVRGLFSLFRGAFPRIRGLFAHVRGLFSRIGVPLVLFFGAFLHEHAVFPLVSGLFGLARHTAKHGPSDPLSFPRPLPHVGAAGASAS